MSFSHCAGPELQQKTWRYKQNCIHQVTSDKCICRAEVNHCSVGPVVLSVLWITVNIYPDLTVSTSNVSPGVPSTGNVDVSTLGIRAMSRKRLHRFDERTDNNRGPVWVTARLTISGSVSSHQMLPVLLPPRWGFRVPRWCFGLRAQMAAGCLELSVLWADSRRRTASICAHCTRNKSRHRLTTLYWWECFLLLYSNTCLFPLFCLSHPPQNEEQALVLWVWHHWDHICNLQET